MRCGLAALDTTSLTTEHLFAILTEHMFAIVDIRRLLSLLAASAVALALVMSYATPSSGASHPHRHGVRAGETLWSIAEHAYPGSDPRDAVYRIEQANAIHSSVISVGQVLVLP
jgi:LysM domain-containing protein